MGTNTSNFGFYKPDTNETGWGSEKNGDWDQLDVGIPIKDTLSNRPADPAPDTWFLATDALELHYYDGSTWYRLDFDGDHSSLTNVASDDHHSKTSSLSEINDADPAEIRTGTLTNRPTAGSSGRWYLTIDNNGIYYDDGSSWLLIAEYPGNISASELGFDPATQTELDNHSSSSGAHHARPAPGTNITEDGSGNFNVSQGSGSGLSADDVDGWDSHELIAYTETATFPYSEIADGDYAAIPIHIQAGDMVEVWTWGIRSDSQTTPSGATIGLYNPDGSVIQEESTAYNTGGPTDSPITTVTAGTSATDIELRLSNSSGGSLNLGGTVKYQRSPDTF